jgi:hypothetical protein
MPKCCGSGTVPYTPSVVDASMATGRFLDRVTNAPAADNLARLGAVTGY